MCATCRVQLHPVDKKNYSKMERHRHSSRTTFYTSCTVFAEEHIGLLERKTKSINLLLKITSLQNIRDERGHIGYTRNGLCNSKNHNNNWVIKMKELVLLLLNISSIQCKAMIMVLLLKNSRSIH